MVAARHPLLARQVRRAEQSGARDDALLLDLVDQAYVEFDAAAARSERAMRLASEELGELTDRLRREAAEAEAARALAEDASAAKTRFLAQMSHELRTPLNAIIGYTEMIAEDLDEAGLSQSRHDAGRVLNAAHHLLQLINEVLDIAKVEAGTLRLSPVVCTPVDVLNEAAAAIAPSMAKEGNRLETTLDPEIGAMLIDPTRLRQCVLNLLSNACKFTRNGVVRLDARRQLDGAGERLAIVVADTGCGMSHEQVARLFEPFVQVAAPEGRLTEGAGLGLAITRRLCHLMGGDVRVESAPGVGSTFTIEVAIVRPGP